MSEQVVKWIYIGRRYRNKKQMIAFLRPDGEICLYRGNAFPTTGLVVGGIYDVTVENDTTMIGHPKWTGDRHDQDDEIAQWQAQDRMAYSEKQLEVRAKNTDMDMFASSLQPLRELYKNSTPPQRAILEAMVLRELRR